MLDICVGQYKFAFLEQYIGLQLFGWNRFSLIFTIYYTSNVYYRLHKKTSNFYFLAQNLLIECNICSITLCSFLFILACFESLLCIKLPLLSGLILFPHVVRFLCFCYGSLTAAILSSSFVESCLKIVSFFIFSREKEFSSFC